MEKKDIEIVCSDCGTIFVWTVGEQEFYAEHEFAQPKRCKACRKVRKATRNKKD